ncbi:MAG: FecR domain-containing protein [Melioribacteraceae bacterium]|nr:FecR domain-containing protein [Melioribacteraceae bacterium]MCF8264121.1 FecR domain-containing protein [Melioribacteraceae bacterium]MCF8412044.1 FecR domain-containing protein [Melioribacteraceae bacterium]
MRRIRYCIPFLIFPILFVFAQSNGLEYTFKKGDNIRILAKQYLGNSNLWEEILKANNLSSVTDIKPGMKIIIPSKQISEAEKEIIKSKEYITKANKAGAKLFSPILIATAIDMQNQSLMMKKISNWTESISYSKQAQSSAEEAYSESLEKNDVSIEAVLNDRKGDVESRTDVDLLWQETPLYATLSEKQRVRTLSDSYAEILFRDESRLRINENSQAVIQKMRYNVLESKQESSVSLVEGDIYALLAGTKRKKMDIEVKGVQTDINSNNFWVDKKGDDVRFANYDEGEITVQAGGKTVMLGQNKGTMVGRFGGPINPEDLLPAVLISSPQDNATAYKTNKSRSVTFKWNKMEGAVSYWLELAYEKSNFQQIVLSRSNIRDTSYTFQSTIVDGVYYWRVAAIDGYGFPGVKSESRLIKILTDESMPFLYINYPKEREIVRESEIKIIGEVENDSELKINDKNVQIGNIGDFNYSLSLEPGINEYLISVKDLAGNENLQKRSVIYIPKQDVQFSSSNIQKSSDNKIISRGGGFNYSGSTVPASSVKLKSQSTNFTSSAISDSAKGLFSVAAPLEKGENKFNVSVLTPAGDIKEEEILVTVDKSPPIFEFYNDWPESIKENVFKIYGELNENSNLKINNEEVSLIENKFNFNLSLKKGINPILIVATDKFDNTTVVSKNVVFDNAPPVLDYKSIKMKSEGSNIELKFLASDDSQIDKIAHFELFDGTKTIRSTAKLEPEGVYYRAIISVPDIKGLYKIKSITLIDKYKNQETYILN